MNTLLLRSAFYVVLAPVMALAQITISPGSLPDAFANSTYPTLETNTCRYNAQLVNFGASSGTGTLSWSVSNGALPPGLSLSASGQLRGEPTQPGSYRFTVRVQDSGGSSGTKDYSVTILPTAFCRAFETPVGRTLRINTSCSGPAAFTYRISDGSLPAGMTLETSGAMAGAPTDPGSSSFTWRCESTQSTLSVGYAVNVGSLPALEFQAVVGTNFNQPFDFADSIVPASMAVIEGSLPPGLSLAQTDTRITGTPTGAGAFSATVRRTAADGAIATAIILITVFQTQPAEIAVTPERLDFTADAGSTTPDVKALVVASLNGVAGPFLASARTKSGGEWLSVEPTSGSVTTDDTVTLTVRADPSGLEAGVYEGAVEVSTDTSFAHIPVTFNVRKFGHQLILSQTGSTIEIEQGVPEFTRFFFRVGDEGSSASGINWTARAVTTSGGNWLRPSAGSGNTSDPDNSFGEGATVNVGGLAAGTYYGFVEVSSSDAGNSPQRATVTLIVRPANSGVAPLLNPGGKIILASPGQTIIPFFAVTNKSASTITYTSTSDAPWLTADDPGQLAPGEEKNYGPVASTAGLQPGVYRGTVTLNFSNNTTQKIRLAMVLRAQSSALSVGGHGQVGCRPNQTVPVFTDLGGGSPPAANQAQSVTVQVVDDCGNPVNRGSVTATFQSPEGMVQTSLTNISGIWGGTITPRSAAEAATVQVTATTEAGVSGNTQESIDVAENPDPPPVFTKAGVVNAASFESEPLAPGTIISIFGSDLSSATVESGGIVADSLPLKTQLGNTQVTIADRPLPLLFVRADQVNAILPFELGDRATEELPLVVQRTDKGSLSTAEPIQLSAAKPGVFSQRGTGEGPGSILDANFRLVDNFNPAKAGDAVQVFATGLGLTDNPVKSNEGAPADPLARATVPVRVTVDGIEAQVLFAGLSPGYAGLFQVNFVVPAGVTPGTPELVIYAGDQPSRSTAIVVQE